MFTFTITRRRLAALTTAGALSAGLTAGAILPAAAQDDGPAQIGPRHSSNVPGVTCVQKFLGVTMLHGTPYGTYGQVTYDAVKQFQQNHKLLQVDGAVGPDTAQAMLNAGMDKLSVNKNPTQKVSCRDVVPRNGTSAGGKTGATVDSTPGGPSRTSTGQAAPVPNNAVIAPSTKESESCSDWQVERNFQTTWTWAHISQAACVVTRGNEVRARLKLRFDWPTGCSIGDGIGCDTNFLAKQEKLTFDRLDGSLKFSFPGTAGEQSHKGALVQAGGTVASAEEGDLFEKGERTRNLDGPWVPRRAGAATVSGQATVNIDSDGHGETVLDKSTLEKDL